MNVERLRQQMQFLMELDKLKSIYRKAVLTLCGSSRKTSFVNRWKRGFCLRNVGL